ncbi:MAG: hypothetical protein QNJ36_08980 [Calothrix sp. MO_167.B42]|nr:hypothetical protein [Calothrix sp. MO_167.B42]
MGLNKGQKVKFRCANGQPATGEVINDWFDWDGLEKVYEVNLDQPFIHSTRSGPIAIRTTEILEDQVIQD